MTAINQKEYLKKYLSLGNEPGKKKKRKKKASTSEKVKIIDDDIDIVTFNQAVEEDLLALNEDAPQIVGVIDDRPLELRIGDYRNTGLWKPVGDETTPFQGGDSPNKVTSQRSLPRDEAPSISDRYNDDYSPPRRRNRSSSPKYKRGSPGRSDDKVRKGYDRESPRSSRRSPVRRNTSDRSPQTPSKRRYDEVDRGRSSPFRKRRRDRDESPIRKGRRSSEDASPPRNRKDWDSSSSRRNRRDQSPGGRDRKYGDANSSGRNRRNFDISPRRKSRFDNFVSPAGRNRQDSTRRSPIDRSPVRRNMRNSDVSPIQRNRRDDDASPIRRNTKGGDGSPLRRNRRDDDTSSIRSNIKGGGASPFRRSRRDDDGSPIRSNMKGGAASPLGRSRRDSDTSPIQRNKTGASSIGRNRRDSDTSPPRSSRRDGASFTKKNRWNSDVSPPRRNRNDASPFTKNRRDSDTSPPRRNRTDSDVGGSHAQSPKWRVADRNPSRVNTDRDVSPPRRNRTDREDSNPRYTRLSPPRSYRRTSDASRGRSQDERSQSGETSRYRPEKSDKPKSISEKDLHEQKIKALSKSRWDQESPRKDSPEVAQPPLLPPLPQFPKKSGLQRANDIIMGKDPSFQPSSDFASLAGFSGGNAAPIVRDRKTGKIRDFEKEEEEAKQKRERDDEMTAKYARWGKGLKQVEDATDKLNSDLHEMTKPLARYADDEDLERHLKEVEREGDPMLAYLRKKKRKQDVEAGKPMKPEFQGEFMPNRYAIRPGHRWDGVDRSNGYEKKWFEMINSRRAQQEESYKWSTEDM